VELRYFYASQNPTAHDHRHVERLPAQKVELHTQIDAPQQADDAEIDERNEDPVDDLIGLVLVARFVFGKQRCNLTHGPAWVMSALYNKLGVKY